VGRNEYCALDRLFASCIERVEQDIVDPIQKVHYNAIERAILLRDRPTLTTFGHEAFLTPLTAIFNLSLNGGALSSPE
jgi:hypothetical protein